MDSSFVAICIFNVLELACIIALLLDMFNNKPRA